MNEKFLNVRCKHCGQRMGLHNLEAKTFTCVNCGEINDVDNETRDKKADYEITLTDEQLTDIWFNTKKYTREEVIAAAAILKSRPVNRWPEGIRTSWMKQYKRIIVLSAIFSLIIIIVFFGMG